MTDLSLLKHNIVNGMLINREQALKLIDSPLDELAQVADEIRNHFCGNGFDLCTIVNGKSGQCSEDCSYCAQSVYHPEADVEIYPLLSSDVIVEDARRQAESGVLRYSVVTSGHSLSQSEVDQLCQSIATIREQVGIEVCVSPGLLDEEQLKQLRRAGASRLHCNLETSKRYFPQICTTHTYQDKVKTLQAAMRTGLSVCSGGIIGLGETITDRIDMLLDLREIGVRSIPINLLNPIAGTRLAGQGILSPNELRRTVAIARFIIPDGAIRLAGGRDLLPDKGLSCFQGGANAAITGDMLTTRGISVATDYQMIESLGYQVRLSHV